MDYNLPAFTIRRTQQFDAWFDGIRDGLTKRRLTVRLRKASLATQQSDIVAAQALARTLED